MTLVPALSDELSTGWDHARLRLSPDAFALLEALADVGVVTPTEFTLEEAIPYDQYEALCSYLGQMNRSCSWWIGDLLLYGEGRYGERFAQAAASTGLAEQTLMNRAWVCSKIPPDRRVPGVPFSVHAAVAARKPGEQKRWLHAAVRNGWTRAQLVAELREADHQAALMRGDTTIERQEVVPPESVEEPPEPGALASYIEDLVAITEDEGNGYVRVPSGAFRALITQMRILATRG